MKLAQPERSIKNIVTELRQKYPKLNYSYARRVWSEYTREKVTNKGVKGNTLRGSPSTSLSVGALPGLVPGGGLPFDVHGWSFGNHVTGRWYVACPGVMCDNRNEQKRFQGSWFSFVIHKQGKCAVYPLFNAPPDRWKGELEDWISSWMGVDAAKLFMMDLREDGRREYAFNTPGVPKNVKVRIRGLGTFSTDTTPFPNGTTEFTADPGFGKLIGEAREAANTAVQISRNALSVSAVTSEQLGKFAEQLELHYQVLMGIQKAIERLVEIESEKKEE